MGAKRKGKQGQPRIRTHDNALDKAKIMGYEVHEYNHDHTIVKHRETGEMAEIPITRSGTRPKEQMSAAEWDRTMLKLVMVATSP